MNGRNMPFKTCTLCQQVWDDREKFITSPNIQLIGYQADFNQPAGGLFLFSHLARGCGTTMAVRVALFLDMYNGPIYKESLTGSVSCSGYCLDTFNLNKCGAKCKMEYIREIMEVLLKAKSDTPQTTIAPR